jgi:hypothetical protein
MNPNIYLHEIIRTVAGREEPYAASVLSLHDDPTRPRAGTARRGSVQFRTTGSSGAWPSVINIWENTWEGQANNLERQFQDAARDTSMEDWWNRNLHLRRGGYDRLLVPAAYSPTIGDLWARDVRTDVVLHEVLWLPFGQAGRYLGEYGQRFLPAAKRLGIELIGAYTVAMRPCQVMTIVGARDWSQLGALLSEDEPEIRAWNEWRSARVERAEELLLLPVRHDRLAGRA